MSFELSYAQANEVFAKLSAEYDIYAPKRFKNAGRYSDTDLIKYDKVTTVEEIVFDEKSDLPAKEVYNPISQTLFYYTEDEYRETKDSSKKMLILMRPCDINAMHHQDKIFLENGGFEDLYYKRRRERVKVVLMECKTGWDTCFCVSMGSNKTEDYVMAFASEDGKLKVEVKDEEFAPLFEGTTTTEFKPAFVEENELDLKVPEIKNKKVLTALKKTNVWKEFDSRCISCGACTIACATCTCFTTTDIAYKENKDAGERRRTAASCQIEGFTLCAGGHEYRTTPGDRMRYKVLHKFHDYKARFKDYHMCVGCGRCMTRCPEAISIVATVDKMAAAIKEIEGGLDNE